ncbi:hypothetical protein ACOMHN_043950 [Nucella lapillus]
MTERQNKLVLCGLILVTLSCVLSKETQCSTDRQKDETVVNCNNKGLTSFPNETDEKVTELNVAFNRISKLPKGALSHLTHLTHLNLAHNLLGEVEPQLFRGLWKLQSVDFSYNQLTVLYGHTFGNLTSLRLLKLNNNLIPGLTPASFEGLSHLLSLDLGNNHLQELANNTFYHLQELTDLSIYGNSLNRLEAGAFCGLNNLTYLDISRNRLEMSSSALPPRVFAPLDKLEDLHIENNHGGSFGYYPDNVFSDLVSLRRLAIETFSDLYFGKEFSALWQIETVDMTDNCGPVQRRPDQ